MIDFTASDNVMTGSKLTLMLSLSNKLAYHCLDNTDVTSFTSVSAQWLLRINIPVEQTTQAPSKQSNPEV
jgi:hypothetical protein